jgi:hypothetical protein
MISIRSLRAVLLPLVLCAACQGKNATSSATSSSAAASSASVGSAGQRAQLRPIVAKNVKVVRCNLPPVPATGNHEKPNNIAATRNLHLAGDGSLYFFPDYEMPVKLEPTKDGCGYRLVGMLPEKKDAQYGVDPNGNIVSEPFNDESKQSSCRVKALGKLRYGNGRLFGTRFLYDDRGLMELDLASKDCEAKELKLDGLPEGGRPDISVAGSDLLLAIGRSDWKYEKEILHLDAKGKVLSRVGSAEGETKISGEVYACGDGYCVKSSGSWLAIHDRTGRRVTTLKLHESIDLEDPYINGVVDVPDKGIYALVGYHPKNQTGHAELVRLDGIL